MGTAADTDHCANLLFVGTCTAGEINKIWSIRPLLFFGKMLKVTFWVNSKPFLQLGAWYTGLVADIYMGTRFFQIRKQQVFLYTDQMPAIPLQQAPRSPALDGTPCSCTIYPVSKRQCAHAVHRNGAHAANRRQWWGYRGKKIRLHCYPAAGQGFAHGSGPWAKQRIQQGRQPIRRKRCADRFKVQEQVRLIPKQRSCQQLVLGAAPQRFGENSCMAAARDTASIPLCSTAWNDARTTGQSCHVRLSDGICLPPIRLIYFIVSRPAGKMQLV